METCVITSKSHRKSSKRKKKQKELKMLRENFKSPSRHLGISKRVIRKGNKNTKRKNYFVESFIQGLSERHISFYQNMERDLSEHRHQEKNLFEETVDLCSGDSSVDKFNSSVLLVSSFELQKRNDVIDLSKDPTDENEIIDLTGTNTSKGFSNTKNSLEPTVIDISEDDPKDPPHRKVENDEVFVIGTFNKNFNFNNRRENPFINPLSNSSKNFSNLITCSEKLKKEHARKKSVLDKINNKNKIQFQKNLGRSKESLLKVGENIYVNSPTTLPSSGLRPIIIDGSNVAFVHSKCNFSCKRLEICINYFKEKGHKVTAFVPQYRLNSHRSDDPQLLRKLERQGDVVLTPSKKVDGRNIVPYDDRFIVQMAALKGGIIVTRDNYNDLLKENPAWAETIKYRTLAFTWVEDVLMFPEDPLGEYGPSLEEFLRFH